MKKLLDTFLELPTWQGILLIGGSVCLIAFIAASFADIGFRRGWNHCRRHWENKEQARSSREASERI